MKKAFFSAAVMVMIFLLMLTGCSFPGSGGENAEMQVAETMVAIAFTQTAMAVEPTLETTAEAEILVETEPPQEVEEVAEVETTEPPVEITHTTIPGNPGWINKWFYDTDSSQGTVTGGDDFVANLYERPFTENEMVYRPDINITKTEMSEDNTFYYVTIYLGGTHPDGDLQGSYGIEVDVNRDGRGDLLVIADRPQSSEWDINGVSVHKDPNKDVGGRTILRPDSGYAGNEYEQVLFSKEILDDPDMAWARVSTSTPSEVTLAFKKSLISTTTFVWGVWAAESLLDPAMMDLHDHFAQSDAGSPYPSHSTYPLKAVNLVDNTCRETYKFEAEEPIPGLCYVPEEETPPPPPPPTETDEPTDEPPEPEPGEIVGVAFDDSNNNGNRDPGEPLTIYSVTISLRAGSCSDPVVTTTNNKSFSFTGLDAGNYCVSISGGSTMTTASSYTVSVPQGGSIYVEFGFYVIT